MSFALARSPRGLGLQPSEFWRLTPAEYWTMHDELIESRRAERSERAIAVLAIAAVIGSKKEVNATDIYQMITGEEPPWKEQADSQALDEIARESKERAAAEKRLKG